MGDPRDGFTLNEDGTDRGSKKKNKIDCKSGGGGKNYYDLPPKSEQLLDLIEYVNMNGNIKDIFKACYRLGRKKGISREYDLRKMALYSLRELGREVGRKDYMALAEEVIGHHDTTREPIALTTSEDVTKRFDNQGQMETAIRGELFGDKDYSFAYIDHEGYIMLNNHETGLQFAMTDYDEFIAWYKNGTH